MGASWDALTAGRELLSREQGTLRREAALHVALAYPAPYRTGMSSLGFQTVYRLLHDVPGVCAERVFLPDDVAAQRRAGPLLTLEGERPVGDYPVVAFSIAWELEIIGLFEILDLAGIPLLAEERNASHPLIVAGGPLCGVNPVPLAAFVDVIVVGDGEEAARDLISVVRDRGHNRTMLLAGLAARPGFYVPAVHGERVPPPVHVPVALLPATSAILTPDCELADMFLVEAERGCARGCTYCVMRRAEHRPMRLVPAARVLAAIPEHARRVGLVGAAVSDHPALVEMLTAIVDSGREASLSSLRADRLTPELLAVLRRGGYRTLTVSADGASERLRTETDHRVGTEHLLKAAELAAAAGIESLKVYLMVGLPGEEDADVEEAVRLGRELRRTMGRVVFGVSPFVPKLGTPLAEAPFESVPTIERRLALLRHGLQGRVEVKPTSARFAWVEYRLAQGNRLAGLAALAAWKAGGNHAAWRKAFDDADA